VQLTADGSTTVRDQLDLRLTPHASWPLAVAVSGGSDSMALLYLAAGWAARRGRHLLVLSVDHGINPQSAQWNVRVAEAARHLGADWYGLVWEGPKPTCGLPAAARRARHALLAQAARDAGARVLLMGHTADDVAEADWMRAAGSSLGQVRSWSPSPVWPEGHGLMVLRPLLAIARQTLRDWLSDSGTEWIDDPANADQRFLRSRARAARPARRPTVETPLPPQDLSVDPGTGVITGPVETPWLGQALVCASGREAIPRRAAVDQLRQRLIGGGGAGVLGGAHIVSDSGRLTIWREPGRRRPVEMPLSPGAVQIWDGRFAVRARQAGWSVTSAEGLRARLSPQDRIELAASPVGARASRPVLMRDDSRRPLLAHPDLEVSCLVATRLRLATGGVQREADI